jgi:hypothetical protein
LNHRRFPGFKKIPDRHLEGSALDELVAEMIELDRNEPSYGEDGVLEEYGMLRDRLKRALRLIETEIGRRTTESRGSS